MSFKPEHFTVWAEIPVTDLDRAIAFYNSVFDTDMQKDESGPNPMAMFPTENGAGIAGNLYPGKPAADGAGPTVHFAIPDTLEETSARVKSAGGKVLGEPVEIPAGKFVYCQDPDGNSLGLFQYP